MVIMVESGAFKDVSPKSKGLEGRLDFRQLPMGGALAMPRSYSKGLPGHVYATWEGPWQVDPAVRVGGKSRAVLRLNGLIGPVDTKSVRH